MTSSSRLRVRLTLRGRVQGVFFRQSTKEQADRLGVSGWVRNLDNGDVEAVAEGPAEAIEAWVRWCHGGPPRARVDSVDRVDEPFRGEFASFEVRR